MFGLNKIFNGSPSNIELFRAVKANDLVAVETSLAKGANPNVKNPDGISALMAAIFGGSVKIINLLLAKGAEINFQDPNGIL